MARIAVGGFQHETNTFAPQQATWEEFVRADAWPPERFEESLTAKILEALTDGVTFERVGTSPAVRVLKRAKPGS